MNSSTFIRVIVGRTVVPTTMFSILVVLISAQIRAEEPLAYNRDIRPILAEHCFACHGPDSASRKADLRLDRRDDAIDYGAITEGEPDESELIARILTDDQDLLMPPPETKKELTDEQKERLTRWIAEGARYQSHWSLIVPEKPQPPTPSQAAWAKNAIDHFVLAELERHGLSPAPEAGARTLFRRLHFDITGLPPAPGDVETFVRDYDQGGEEALSNWIDRLMSSSAWGEHRARYWLDAARYGDTHGLHFDNYREMWPYRDWVIRAFNANLRFDQFTIEQLAGDLLPNPTDDQLIATGFQRCNITTNEGGTIDEENLANYAADRVQTFGWVYLGLTTNCSQCHDHKFDPFTTRDYYSLAAFFRNTTQGPKDGNVKDGRGPVLTVPTEADRPRFIALPGEIASAKAQRHERGKNARADFNDWIAAATAESLDDDVPLEGLAVYVPLTDGAGSEVASGCGEATSFQATGEVKWVPDGKLGPAPVMKLGGTFDLGGNGDFEKDQPFSVGAWIRAGKDNVSGGIIARMDEKANYRGWDLWQQGRSVAMHMINTWPDNGLKVVSRDAVLKKGEWKHVFATYDGSGKPGGVKIYVDGKEVPVKVEKNTLKADASIRTATPLRIGQRSDTQVFDGGAIQDVRVYSRSLGATEVRALADVIPLKAFLATAEADRTREQEAALFKHYLATRDREYSALASEVSALESELETIRARSPITHIQKEKEDSPAMAYVLMRGEYDKPGDKVDAATPASLHPMHEEAPKNRLGLAEWLVDPANPLTARVTVNRYWQQVFGRGIVATPEDFGVMGSEPSHRELLDWLAIEFQENGWDVKALFKLMLMSATYRQSAVATAEKLEKDRENILLSRGPRFRMDAEMLRDFTLSASGLLSPKMYGPGVKPYQPEAIWDVVGLPGGNTRKYEESKGDDLYRRTIYTFWKRMAPPPSLDAFNAPSREVCTVQRERTNTPLQALVTLNDPQFVEAARRLAEQAVTKGGDDDVKTMSFIAGRLLGRPLEDAERAIIDADRAEFLSYYESHPEDAAALIAVGDSQADAKLSVPRLAAWTMVCNQMMNLDESLNK